MAARTQTTSGATGSIHELTVKEADTYRSRAQRLREEADQQADPAIGEQYRKIADRYDELAEQVEATIRRSD